MPIAAMLSVLMLLAPAPAGEATVTSFIPEQVQLFEKDGRTVKGVRSRDDLQAELKKRSVVIGEAGPRNTVEIQIFGDVYFVRKADIVFVGALPGPCQSFAASAAHESGRSKTATDAGVASGASGTVIRCVR